VLAQITELEVERDAVAKTDAPDQAGKMIQQLTRLRGIGVQSATVLVRKLLSDALLMARRSVRTPASPRPRIAAGASIVSGASGKQATVGSER
jgi:hypothetical protein